MDQIKGKKKSRDIRSSGDGAGIKNQEEKDRRGGKKKKEKVTRMGRVRTP
jgi:hypothetical protein